MGHDTVVLARHYLKDVTNMEALAAELAQRWNATIHFGYQQDDPEQYIIKFLGVAGGGPLILTMLDENYCDRQAGRVPQDHVHWSIQDKVEKTSDYFNCDIYKSCFETNYSYDGRWWNFCDFFMNQRYPLPKLEKLSHLERERSEIWEAIDLLDGDVVIIIDDQGASNQLRDMAPALDWEALLTYGRKHLGSPLYISDWLMNHDSDTHWEPDFPSWFFDDFSFRLLSNETVHSQEPLFTMPVSKDLARAPTTLQKTDGPTWEPEEWYELLVEQSRTDHIYNLIHENIYHLWNPGHYIDFVTVRRSELPTRLLSDLTSHMSDNLAPDQYSFPKDDFILLSNDELTEYLEAAIAIETIEDREGRSFLHLKFKPDGDKRPETTPDDNPKGQDRNLLPEEAWLAEAYDELIKDGDQQKVLVLLPKIEHWLITGLKDVVAKTAPIHAMQWLAAWNIVAMCYAWCRRIDKAAEADTYYLFDATMWEMLEEPIKGYLTMLMIREELDYLERVFSDTAFRTFFVLHYEAYISLFKDPHYEITVTQWKWVALINTIKNSRQFR